MSKALGKGLGVLFRDELNIEKIEQNIDLNQVINISINDLKANPYQPRKVFDKDALEELASSIRENGVFQPILVKKTVGSYYIIAGERRYRASKLANLKTVPAVVCDFTDEQMMKVALLENLQREDLNVIEEAKAYENLISKLNLTHDELAKQVGKSRSHITNILGILKLPEQTQKHILKNEIQMGHARALSKLDDENLINFYTKEVIKKNMSVRTLEALLSNAKKEVVSRPVSVEQKSLENSLEMKLGTKVNIDKNKLVINFANDSDLNRLLEIMGLLND